MVRLLVALALACASGALGSAAQVCSPGNAARRTLAVNVLDAQAQPVRGLTAANFRGQFRGGEVAILSVAPDAQPRRIVLLVDVSESMGARPGKWELAAAAAEDFLRWGPADSAIALMTFGEKVEPRTGFELESAPARQALKAVRPAGASSDPSGTRTALRDAVVEAARLLTPGHGGDVIYLITDALDTFSQAKDEQVEAALVAAGARLFVLVLGDVARPDFFLVGPGLQMGPITIGVPLTTSPFEQYAAVGETSGYVPLRPLVDASGGLGMTVRATGRSAPRFDFSAEERAGILSQTRLFYGAMGEFYRVEVELPAGLERAREWDLEVVKPSTSLRPGAPGKKPKDLLVVYPHKLAPCASEP